MLKKKGRQKPTKKNKIKKFCFYCDKEVFLNLDEDFKDGVFVCPKCGYEIFDKDKINKR